MIRIKRVYEAADEGDGLRVLVDRVWPRGMTKTDAGIDEWRKQVAPSDELRKWFRHDPGKWPEFKRRYFAELDHQPDVWRPLVEASREETITLVYSAKDEQHNNAVALKAFLDGKQRGGSARASLDRAASPRSSGPRSDGKPRSGNRSKTNERQKAGRATRAAAGSKSRTHSRNKAARRATAPKRSATSAPTRGSTRQPRRRTERPPSRLARSPRSKSSGRR